MLTHRRQPYAKGDCFRTVLCDEVPIGAIVKPSDLREWHLSITIQVNAETSKNGKSETRAAALAEFHAAWKRFRNEIRIGGLGVARGTYESAGGEGEAMVIRKDAGADKPAVVIKNWRDYLAARERREDLAEPVGDGPETQESSVLKAAIEAWQKKHGIGPAPSKQTKKTK